MQSNPGAGIQLDVTESTVAFTPPGGGQAMPVGQGNGLSVSQAGVPTPRPINPVVAQTISITNQVATQVTANVSLNVVSGAMNEATAESQSSEESEGEGEGEGEARVMIQIAETVKVPRGGMIRPPARTVEILVEPHWKIMPMPSRQERLEK